MDTLTTNTLWLAQADAASLVKIGSVWDFLVKGGPVMIPLGVVSLIALAITIERAISLRRARIIPPRLLAEIDSRRATRPDGRRRAIDYCKTEGSLAARIAGVVLQHAHDASDLQLDNISRACERELRALHKYDRVLPLVIAMAPMLGLLGTITGMIQAFSTVASSAEALGRTELLAKGIYEAMITTAAGLMIAIPTMVAHHWLSGRVHRLTTELDDVASELLARVREEQALTVGLANTGHANAGHANAGDASAAARPPTARAAIVSANGSERAEAVPPPTVGGEPISPDVEETSAAFGVT